MDNTFYKNLNQSTKTVDNQSYIHQTSLFMDEKLRRFDNLSSLLLIGAGNLNDLSLDFFLKHFDKILLTDIDIDSLHHKLSNQIDQKVHIKQIDYIGASKTDFFKSIDQLLNMNDMLEVKKFIDVKMKGLLQYHFHLQIKESFNCIYISPIYTQLLYREFEFKVNELKSLGLKQHIADQALSNVLQHMVEIIDHFNSEIVSLLKDDGIVFVASDILALTNNQFSKDVKEAIEDQGDMEKLYQTYHQRYGYGLGDYGLFSLTQALHLSRTKWLIWNQDDKHQHAVKFCEYNKEPSFEE